MHEKEGGMIGRKCYRALVLSFLTATCAHALDVGGHIQTSTWTAADSPVRVVDTVYVDVGATLTIGPGVDVLFDVDAPFCVAGSLVAEGTATDSIRFLPGNVESWHAILFGDGSDGHMAFVRVSGCDYYAAMDVEAPFYFDAGGSISGIGARVHLRHCVIRGNTSYKYGAGLFLRACTAEIDTCLVEGNRSLSNGGGIHLSTSACAMTGCVVTGNSPHGVLANASSRLTMTGCVVKESFAGDNPYEESGGLVVESSTASLTGCTLERNTAPVWGGGLYLREGQASLTDCRIVGNTSPKGSAVYVWRGTAELLGCTAADNAQGELPPGAEETEPSAIEILEGGLLLANSVVWGNTGRSLAIPLDAGTDSSLCRVEYSDLQGDEAWPGPGNICADPLFVDSEHGNYALRTGSPCIDSGSPYYLDADGTRADMGGSGDCRLDTSLPWIDVTQSGDCGVMQSGEIAITNRGGGELTVTAIDFPDDFVTATVFPLYVAPGETEVVLVAYAGTERDTVATAAVNHNDPHQQPWPVSLRGLYGTTVSGTQYGRWTVAGSPYRVVGAVDVPLDKTLIIDAGVEVRFEKVGFSPLDDGIIHALGRLLVEGTETDSVRFTLGRPDAEAGVATHSGGPHGIEYAVFDGMTQPVLNGSGELEIAHCSIRNSAGVTTAGPGFVRMRECDIIRCSHGLEIEYGAAAEVTGCRVSRNTCDTPIIVRGTALTMANCVVSVNVAAGLAGGGPTVFLVDEDGYLSLSQCTVVGNLVSGGQAVSIRWGTVDVLGSILSDNAHTDVVLWSEESGSTRELRARHSNIRSVRVSEGDDAITYRNGYPGEGNISAYPLFVDSRKGDYRLSPGSPCIDTGMPHYLDADGSPADMGAYGGTGGPANVPHIGATRKATITYGGLDTVDVWNSGGAALSIDSVTFAGAFETALTFPQTIDPGDTLHLPISFVPARRIDTDGMLMVYSSDTHSPAVTVRLRGNAGGTAIGGVVTGTLTAEGSPYRITDHIVVPEGEALEIEPGVCLMVDSWVAMTVKGSIHVRGTEQDSVVISPGRSDSWLGMSIGGGDSSSFSHVRFACPAGDGQIWVGDQHRLFIGDCVLQGGYEGAVVVGDASRVVVADTEVRVFGHRGGQCRLNGSGTVVFDRCRFRQVSTSLMQAYGAMLQADYVDSLVMTDCTFEHGQGGTCLNAHNTNARIEGCSFVGNTLSESCIWLDAGVVAPGGDRPAYNSKTVVRMRGCTIEDNRLRVGWSMAPLVISGDTLLTVELVSCTIVGNMCTGMESYSGVVVRSAFFPVAGGLGPEVIIANTVIAGNSSTLPTAVRVTHGYAGLRNCTVTGNTSDIDELGALIAQDTGAVFAVAGSPGRVHIHNSIVWGTPGQLPARLDDGVSATYSCIVGGHAGEGNISLAPMFADSAGGDFTLLTGSPCIDAGDPDSPLDQDGTRCDMGAHANINEALAVEQTPARLELSLGSPFPNPFNPTVSIPFTVPETGHVALTVYNVQGQVVRRLVDGAREAGTQAVAWDGRDELGRPAASGVYLCRLTTTAGARVRRMLLVR